MSSDNSSYAGDTKYNGCFIAGMDYIYYRMYVWYVRKGDCAPVTSMLFITAVKFFLWFPLAGFVIASFSDGNKNANLAMYLLYAVLVFVHSLVRYAKRKDDIFARYKRSKYNRSVSNWLIFSSLPLSIVGGVSIYIFLYVSVITPYCLNGKLLYVIDML